MKVTWEPGKPGEHWPKVVGTHRYRKSVQEVVEGNKKVMARSDKQLKKGTCDRQERAARKDITKASILDYNATHQGRVILATGIFEGSGLHPYCAELKAVVYRRVSAFRSHFLTASQELWRQRLNLRMGEKAPPDVLEHIADHIPKGGQLGKHIRPTVGLIMKHNRGLRVGSDFFKPDATPHPYAPCPHCIFHTLARACGRTTLIFYCTAWCVSVGMSHDALDVGPGFVGGNAALLKERTLVFDSDLLPWDGTGELARTFSPATTLRELSPAQRIAFLAYNSSTFVVPTMHATTGLRRMRNPATDTGHFFSATGLAGFAREAYKKRNLRNPVRTKAQLAVWKTVQEQLAARRGCEAPRLLVAGASSSAQSPAAAQIVATLEGKIS